MKNQGQRAEKMVDKSKARKTNAGNNSVLKPAAKSYSTPT